ncbi:MULTISPECIES: hypothetical protein [unclassified Bosea (in: a-proteobacteria)]|uniref:hypothetical protein n=1 Tax=unclassified Bosea (in: a-proteobacteria) TaxID=2653178 RepID=UPI000F75A5A1|nr:MULTISPECIES: hypothetical protein [unclassified Bosea (in: a-proteobacteria)]AZO82017.1 hypothetical protein BLM15_29940 [Bosea sp. Tri-49]MCV9937404.1 hypothetical protein [Boseaceae bacterium BT-24-1]RXT16661.1 hypothetical protein B5U98_27420 [Bosea sp. Tri-39]RXT42418.1 hypothetical protein B5U99_00500 [Bosea sp. Tri-54]
MSKQPPIPPANRSDKGPGEPSHQGTDAHEAKPNDRPSNTASQGQQGNTKINTTHQGHQQDR